MDKCYQPHFKDEETQTQKVTKLPKDHIVPELGLEPSFPDSES